MTVSEGDLDRIAVLITQGLDPDAAVDQLVSEYERHIAEFDWRASRALIGPAARPSAREVLELRASAREMAAILHPAADWSSEEATAIRTAAWAESKATDGVPTKAGTAARLYWSESTLARALVRLRLTWPPPPLPDD